MATTGGRLDHHVDSAPAYMPNADPGRHGGGTYTSHDIEPTLEAWENIFGPSARDIKQDMQRFKRHGRWHLPDILKGPNQYLTDRIDGLITDAANSLFTSKILPYKYTTNVDGKIKWNVWAFDEGLASRVPYESAARTLTQSKRSYSGYMVRQGMAIVLEHNFMMTQAGRENFKNQLMQLKGSIQLTNDLDVHVALVLAPSYQKTMSERYLAEDKTPSQICREFVDLFGFVQKNQNALDILIEEAKSQLRVWGGPMPDFLMCNPKLTFQLTMTPDRTNYVTQGAEGPKRLRSGPEMSTYRGIGIIHTRAFSMETGAPPRDILRRRIRVAEFYRILPSPVNAKRLFGLYNEERDTWFYLSFVDLLRYADCEGSQNNNRVKLAIDSLHQEGLSSKASLSHPAGAGLAVDASRSLGVSGPRFGGDGTVATVLGDLYVKLFRHAIHPEFTMKPRFVTSGLVHVPGAIDMCDVDVNTQAMWVHNTNDVPIIPMIRRAAVSVYGNDFFNGRDAVERKRFQIIASSVEEYPRGFRTAYDLIVVAAAAAGDTQNLYNAFDAYSRGVVAAAGIRNLIASVTMRNHNRYAVPTGLVNMFSDGSLETVLSATTIRAVVDSATDRFNVGLRRIGAFMSPNHYRHRNEGIKGLGSIIGYNMLMTAEVITALLRKTAAGVHDHPLYNTILASCIADPTDVTNATLLAAIGNFLITQVYDRYAGQKRTRLELQYDLNALAGQIVLAGHGTANEYCAPNFFFWTWPATDSSAEDAIFAGTPLGAVLDAHVRAAGAAADNWIVTNAFLTYMRAHNPFAKNAHVFTTEATIPRVQEPNDAAAVGLDFMHAMAFRLFGDQELQAPAQVISGGGWPSPDDYLSPSRRVDSSWMRAVEGVNELHPKAVDFAAQTEVVIVRPNIEHYMLGIILGQGGEGLGSTFWGQTELSVYDDSMHGIWGMSYKYHERAMVINERNLVRLWDVAYDGYVGGKDDTYVNWNDTDQNSEKPNSVENFRTRTLEVTRHYRGPSMMVMAFNHQVGDAFHDQFRANWPSPIIFYDDPGNRNRMPIDYDNLHVIPTEEFRVFDTEIYRDGYNAYKSKMPDFATLHRMRKNAGLAAVEHEVSSDALAFQGTMRVQTTEGQLVQEIAGSGHHGPDFVGVASLRAGKGYKINSQPTIQRLV